MLKDEIRIKIMNSAETCFFKSNFEKASMRDIADGAGITLSNIYKYFKNKNALFDAVIADYSREYVRNFNSFVSHEKGEDFSGKQKENLKTSLLSVILHDRNKFIILMEKSAGTDYADFKNRIISVLSDHMFSRNAVKMERFACILFASNLFSNIVEIAKHYKNEDWARDNISAVVEYHLGGMKAVM